MSSFIIRLRLPCRSCDQSATKMISRFKMAWAPGAKQIRKKLSQVPRNLRMSKACSSMRDAGGDISCVILGCMVCPDGLRSRSATWSRETCRSPAAGIALVSERLSGPTL